MPVPASGLRPRHVTGYWRHDSGGGADVDATIAEFIAQSGRLVAIGFGSMASREPAETLAMLRAAEPAAALAHPYFRRAQPVTMLIDDVETIWNAIDKGDDWSLFNAKIDDIRQMGAAHAPRMPSRAGHKVIA